MTALRILALLAVWAAVGVRYLLPPPAQSETPPEAAAEITRGPASPIGNILGPPSLSAAQIDEILSAAGSPAAGTGAAFVRYSLESGIDDAYALAFFQHESSFGTAPGWAGWKPNGDSSHSIGNIICAGWAGACWGRFRDYASWDEGIADWYALIAREYVPEGRTTVATIIPKYAPAFENDVDNYIAVVTAAVAGWRRG